MNKIAYYHTYLTDNSAVWSSIIMEQFKVMEDSGLIGDLDGMNITAITQEDNRMQNFVYLCESFGFKKLKVFKVKWRPNSFGLTSASAKKSISSLIFSKYRRGIVAIVRAIYSLNPLK